MIPPLVDDNVSEPLGVKKAGKWILKMTANLGPAMTQKAFYPVPVLRIR